MASVGLAHKGLWIEFFKRTLDNFSCRLTIIFEQVKKIPFSLRVEDNRYRGLFSVYILHLRQTRTILFLNKKRYRRYLKKKQFERRYTRD